MDCLGLMPSSRSHSPHLSFFAQFRRSWLIHALRREEATPLTGDSADPPVDATYLFLCASPVAQT